MTMHTEEENLIRLYLLGQANEEEQRRVEERLLRDNEYVELLRMIEDELIDDYARGALPALELRLFERQFLATPKRLNKLAAAKALVEYAKSDSDRVESIESEAVGAGRWFRALFFPRWKIAIFAALIVGLGLAGWRICSPKSKIDGALTNINSAWLKQRPVEARVAGDFPYLPYKPTRGQKDSTSANHDQLLAAKAELTREVTAKPTAQAVQARQALGRLFLLESDYDEAERYLESALKESPRNVSILVDLAALYYERGSREQSLTLLTRAADHCKNALAIEPSNPEARFNLALCHEQMMLVEEAQSDWENYLKIDSSSPWADEARARLQKLRLRSEAVPPSTLFDELLAIAAANDENRLRALLASRFDEASGEAVSGRFVDEFLAARAAGDEIAAEKRRAVLKRIADFARDAKGENYPADLLGFAENAEPGVVKRMQEIRARLRQAEESHVQGQYEQSLSLYAAASQSARQIGDVCDREEAEYGLARAHIPGAETRDRLKMRERLVAETSRHRHRRLQARALLALANAYGSAQRFSANLSASLKAYEIAQSVDDTDTTVNALRFAGNAYLLMGEDDLALQNTFAAVRLIQDRAASTFRVCQAYYQVADTLSVVGRYQPALDYQLEALSYCERLPRKDFAALLQGRIGFHYLMTGQDEKAARFLREAITGSEKYEDKIGRNVMLMDMQTLLGQALLKQNRLEEAVSAYRKAMKTIESASGYSYQSAVIHSGVATALLKLGRAEEAESELQAGIRLIEQARENINDLSARSLYSGSKLSVYRTMIGFQWFARKSVERAFDYAEICRNRELLDAISGADEFKWRPSRAVLEYSSSAPPLTLQQVQRAMPRNAQLVEYAVTEGNLLIWMVTADKVKQAQVGISQEELRRRVSEYLQELTSEGEVAALNAKAAGLYRILIEPILNDLDAGRAVVIVPDDVLGALCFPALVSPASQRYLIEDFTLMTSPSASVLARTIENGRAKPGGKTPSLLGLSHPEFDYRLHPSLKPLPETEREIESAMSLYPVRLHLSRERATKRLLLPRIGAFEIAHLATHSLINERNPLLSSIVLSVGAPEDMKPESSGDENLRAYEIFGIKAPRTRLVILSSCRSGVNAGLGRGGFGGLAQAFFSAGVPAVLASLWEVDDESAAELMKSFHYSYRVERRTFGDALRQAQLKMIRSAKKEWRHPLHWAAFSLSGNGLMA